MKKLLAVAVPAAIAIAVVTVIVVGNRKADRDHLFEDAVGAY